MHEPNTDMTDPLDPIHSTRWNKAKSYCWLILGNLLPLLVSSI
jgi:hypothetical protein